MTTVHRSDYEQLTSRWVPVSVILLSLVIGSIWWVGHGASMGLFDERVPPGQVLYVLSKLVALIAIAVMSLQVAMGVLRRLQYMAPLSLGALRWHARIGMMILALLLAHVLLFFLAVTIRTGEPAWLLFVPRPLSGYYELGLSAGLCALLLAIATVYTGVVLRRQSRKAQWARRIHWVAFGTIAAAFLHGYMIGSEQHLLYLIVGAGFVTPLLTVALCRAVACLQATAEETA